MILQESGHFCGILTVLRHPQMQGFQADIGQKRVLRRLAGPQISHQLRRCLGDIGALSKFFRVDNAVVGLIRRGQARKLVRMGHPVEIAGIHDGSAHSHGMAVHILGGGMGHDVHTPGKGPAVDGSRKGIVTDHGYSVIVRQLHELLNIQDHAGRVGDGLREHSLRVGAECFLQLLRRSILIHQGYLQTKALQSHSQKIGSASIALGSADHMVPGFTDIGNGQKGSRLSGRSQHGRGSAFQLADFCGHHIAGGILKSGVEISFLLQIEQGSHLLAGVIFIRCTLIDGKHSGAAVLRLPASLHTD